MIIVVDMTQGAYLNQTAIIVQTCITESRKSANTISHAHTLLIRATQTYLFLHPRQQGLY